MKRFAAAALILASASASACPQYNGYVEQHFPTSVNYIAATIDAWPVDNGTRTSWRLFGYAPKPAAGPKKGDVWTDFSVRDASMLQVTIYERSCEFVIVYEIDPAAKEAGQ